MLVKNITKQVDIPHEPGEWVLFRKLSWRQLDEASNLASDASFERMKKLGGDLLQALRDSAKQEDADTAVRYDRSYVLHNGIMKWSYDDEVSDANIDALDEETAEWAYYEILKLNQQTGAEIKNG